MIRLLAFLWTGCWHHWERDRVHIIDDDGIPIGLAYYCTCTKCGTPKRFALY